jgi:hypothetical protein
MAEAETLKGAEALVRRVLSQEFRQRADDATVASVAQKVSAAIPQGSVPSKAAQRPTKENAR